MARQDGREDSAAPGGFSEERPGEVSEAWVLRAQRLSQGAMSSLLRVPAIMKRRHSKPSFPPGWKMTVDQRRSYWRMWGDICRVLGWEPTAEARYDWHEASGLGRCSVKEIDHLTGFDELKKYWLAVTQPANLQAQLAMAKMKCTRLMTRIRWSFPEALWKQISRDKFKTEDLNELKEEQLEQLRNTCDARGYDKVEEPF